MRKRLKKKFEIGPYRRFGFDVTGQFVRNADHETFIDEFCGLLAKHQLQTGGAYGSEDFQLYVDAGTRTMDPVQQRRRILDWLNQRHDVASFQAQALVDVYDQPFRP